MMPCPTCGSTAVRISKTSYWSDVFNRGLKPLRCQNCRKRFFAAQDQSSDKAAVPGSEVRSRSGRHSRPRMSTSAKRRLRRRLIFIFLFAAALAIFGLFLRFITREPSSSTEFVPASAFLIVTGLRGSQFRGTWNHLALFIKTHSADLCASRSAADYPAPDCSLSEVRAAYRRASITNIQPETEGRGNGKSTQA